jgi:hypothetical protein
MEKVYLHHPSAAALLEEMIKILEDRNTGAERFCEQAVVDARHDLAILESAGLYLPRVKE